MKRILITGAGGPASIGFTRSLRKASERYYLVGVDADKYGLQLAETDEKYLIPRADDPAYIPVLRQIIDECSIDFIHAQPDPEIPVISRHRDILGAKVFLPAHETIETCLDKFRSFQKWKEAGLRVPETVLIRTENDLKEAFKRLGSPLWIRAIKGAAGKQSLPATNFNIAKEWINFWNGWGSFTAAEYLPGVAGLQRTSVTWMSIWKDGKLVVAQGRERLSWAYADRAPSGITGLTRVGRTIARKDVDEIAQRAILAIDPHPHGVFSVDLTEDKEGVPCPTEINIGRFFTTHQFFTEAGLNMPEIYVRLAFDEAVHLPRKLINPLPEGLCWIRSIDCKPVLIHDVAIDVYVQQLRKRLAQIEKPSNDKGVSNNA
jgi:hypothetical protein